MYIALVDFTKAFDTVDHDLVYAILGKLGCPAKFIRIIKEIVYKCSYIQDLSSMVN